MYCLAQFNVTRWLDYQVILIYGSLGSTFIGITWNFSRANSLKAKWDSSWSFSQALEHCTSSNWWRNQGCSILSTDLMQIVWRDPSCSLFRSGNRITHCPAKHSAQCVEKWCCHWKKKMKKAGHAKIDSEHSAHLCKHITSPNLVTYSRNGKKTPLLWSWCPTGI